MWSLRNHGGYTLLMQFCSMASPTLQLCFVKCSVYLFVDFQKNMQSNQSVFASRPLFFSPKPSRMKMLIFQPPNNPTPSENGRSGLKKQRGFKGSFVRVIKRPPLLIFTSFVCYLRQLYFGMYSASHFSYSLKSSFATYAHLFNTEKNHSSIEKLRLWIT